MKEAINSMFYIPYKKDVAKWYLEKQGKICRNRISSIQNNIKKNKYYGKDPKTLFELLHCIENYLNVILIGKPDELLKVHNEIKELFPAAFIKPTKNEDNPLYDAISSIFDYDSFTKYYKGFAYKLTKKLDINICPYWNREFIYTVSDENDLYTETECLIRAELDHYFPQSKYPLLTLSFCNLIPSGHICNSNIKLSKDLEIENHLHPYIKSRAKVQFYTDLKSGKDDSFTDEINPPEIVIQYKITKESDDVSGSEEQKAANTFNFFGLQRIYQSHNGVANRIQEIFRSYPPDLITDILQRIENDSLLKHITKEKLFEILFSEFNIEAPENEMLGNLKQDLYREMQNFYDECWKATKEPSHV